jgi:hypothetical protein
MPVTVDGIEYLNAGESARFLKMGPMTFRVAQKQYNLKWVRIFGHGKSRYFKKSDLASIPLVQPLER